MIWLMVGLLALVVIMLCAAFALFCWAVNAASEMEQS